MLNVHINIRIDSTHKHIGKGLMCLCLLIATIQEEAENEVKKAAIECNRLLDTPQLAVINCCAYLDFHSLVGDLHILNVLANS